MRHVLCCTSQSQTMTCRGALSVKVHAISREAGFTLVELMVAVAIISIAVGLAMPYYSEWQAQSKLRQATSEIATQLTLARMAAMNRNRSVDVTVENLGGTVHISAVSSGVAVIKDKNLPPRVTSVIGSPITVSFSSMGLRTSGGTGVQSIGV